MLSTLHNVKLGKLPPVLDMRTMRAAKYLAPDLPIPPAQTNWRDRVGNSWGVMLNAGPGAIGDCGIAGQGHALQTWTANVDGILVTVPDLAIRAAYSAVSGYNPMAPLINGENPTDTGVDLLSALKYWKRVGLAAHRINSYAAMDFGDVFHVKQCVALFGGTYAGLALPVTAQNQRVWDVDGSLGALFSGKGRPGSWGGHCVWVPDFNPIGPIAVSWGMLIQMTWRFWLKYADEAYVVNADEWFNRKQSRTPSGLDRAQMDADALALAA